MNNIWFLAMMLISLPAAAEDVQNSSAYRANLRDYVLESEEFLKTFDTTQQEIRLWRQIYLGEKLEQKMSSVEKTLYQSDQQIIETVEKTIQKTGLDSLDDVLLLRMAQLQYDKESLSLSEKMKNYEEQLKSFLSGRAKARPELPSPNYIEAIRYARTLLTRFPRSPLSDKAHYLMAYSYEEMQQLDSAVEIYRRLLRRHPYSQLADEVKWRVGEYYFDIRDLNKAAYYYTELLKKADSPFYLKALYKLAAALFAGDHNAEATQKFLELYRAVENAKNDTRDNATLKEEAIQYLAVLKSYHVEIKIDKEVEDELVQRIAESYQRLPSESRARQVYIDFMKLEPYSVHIPAFANQTILSYSGEGKNYEASELREKLVTFLTRSPQWWKVNFENRKSTFEAEDLLEEYLLESAEAHAEQGFEKNDRAKLQMAHNLYREFLKQYPFSPQIPRARLEMAKVEYFAGQYKAAQESFQNVLKDPAAKDFYDDAAYGNFLSVAREVQYPIDKEIIIEPKRSATGELLPPQSLSEKDKTFLAAAQLYTNTVGASPRRQQVLYKVAEVHFQNNNFDLSDKAAQMVIDDKDNVTITTAKALRLSGEIANIHGDWKLVSERNQQLLALNLTADAKQINELKGVTAGTEALQTASRLETGGRRLEAAQEYERVATGLPNADFAPYAYWKAAQLYHDEGNFKEALENLAHLKETRYESESQFLVASSWKHLLNFEKAISTFELFAKMNPKHPWASEALFMAAALRRDLKQYPEAIKDFSNFYDLKPLDTALFEAMDLAAQIGNSEEVRKLAAKLAAGSRETQVRVQAYLVEAYLQVHDRKMSNAVCQEMKPIFKKIKGESAQTLRAKGLCRLAEVAKSFDEAQVDSAVKDFKKFGLSDLVGRLMTYAAEEKIKQGKMDSARQYVLEGWASANGDPYSAQGIALYPLMLKTSQPVPIHIGLLVNWNLAAPTFFSWANTETQQLAWGNARSLCEREIYDQCVDNVRKLSGETTSEEMKQNYILALLKAGRDAEALDVLRDLGEKSKWAQSWRRWAYLLNAARFLPDDKKSIEVPEPPLRAEGLTAEAARLFQIGQYKKALQSLQSAIHEDPAAVAPYVFMARILHETGHYQLMLKALDAGVQNTKSHSGLLGLQRIWQTVLSPGTQKHFESQEQDDSQALYGLGVAAAFSDNSASFESISSVLEKRGVWAADLTAVSALLKNKKVTNSKELALSNHLQLLKSISDRSQKEFSSVSGFFENKFLKEWGASIK